MRKSYAWATVLGALVLGVAAGNLLTRAATPALQLSIACVLLAEAETAGHLDARKRATLVAKVRESDALTSASRDIAGRLGSECPAKP